MDVCYHPRAYPLRVHIQGRQQQDQYSSSATWLWYIPLYTALVHVLYIRTRTRTLRVQIAAAAAAAGCSLLLRDVLENKAPSLQLYTYKHKT